MDEENGNDEWTTAVRELYKQIYQDDIQAICSTFDRIATRIPGVDHTAIFVVDQTRNELISNGVDGEVQKGITVSLDERDFALQIACQDRTPVLFGSEVGAIEDVQTVTVDTVKGAHPESVPFPSGVSLILPLVDQENDLVLGAIEVSGPADGEPFPEQEVMQKLETLSEPLVSFFKNKSYSIEQNRFVHLLEDTSLSPPDLSEAQQTAIEKNTRLENVLMDQYDVSREQIGDALSEFFDLPYQAYHEDLVMLEALPEGVGPDLMEHQVWGPFRTDDESICVVMENPLDLPVRDYLSSLFFEKDVEFRVGTLDDIEQIIDQYRDKPKRTRRETGNQDEKLQALLNEIQGSKLERNIAGGQEQFGAGHEARDEEVGKSSLVIRMVNFLIDTGYENRASDIHIECSKDSDIRVRYRIDGILHEFFWLPAYLARPIISRVKIMSGLDIAERRLPQDGKIRYVDFGRYAIELRVATVPKAGGIEDAVLRILSSSELLPLNKIGMRQPVYEQFTALLQRSYGIILCVGPTGSGKTTTLHAALNHIKDSSINIWTAEDPVEINQKGLRQVQVKEDIGLTFSQAMRSFLRADPDVIMVGEMRDKETADIAVRASLTGHLVFSTLHTNNAPETVTRLLDLGLDPFYIGDAILGVQAQRLVRKFCDSCKTSLEITDDLWEQIKEEFGHPELFEEHAPSRDEAVMFEATGCNDCNQTGYAGRTGIHELLVSTEPIKKMIKQQAPSDEIREEAQKNGMLTLKQDGVIKVLEGKTDLKQVKRVVS